MKKKLVLLISLVLIICTISCQQQGEKTQELTTLPENKEETESVPVDKETESVKTEESEKNSPEVQIKDTLIIAQGADIKSSDPLIGVTTYSISVNRHVFDWLIILNEDGSYSPGLAESWELLNPNLVQLDLRQGVLFHDGTEMTSEDVVFSLERARDLPLSLIQGMFGEIKAIDKYTVQVELLKTFGTIELLFCRTGTQIVSKKAVEKDYDAFIAHPIGTGVYKFVSWSKGSEIVLEAFQDYWGEKAKSNKLIIKIIAEPSQRLIALENGEIDIAYDIGANDVTKVTSNPKLKLLETASSRCVMLSANYKLSTSPIADKRVLQAIQYAINKELIVEAVGYGHGSVAHTMIPPFVFGASDKIKTEYNLEKAKELLNEAGYPDGFEIDLITYSDQLYSEIGSVIQSQLAEVGIKVNLSVMDQATLLDRCADENHGLILKYWMTVADAHNTFAPYYLSESTPSHGNSAFYNNPEMDALIEIESNSADQKVRKETFDKIHEIAAEDLPFIPVYYTPMLVGLSSSVEGFTPDPYGYHWLGEVSVGK